MSFVHLLFTSDRGVGQIIPETTTAVTGRLRPLRSKEEVEYGRLFESTWVTTLICTFVLTAPIVPEVTNGG